MNTEQTSKNNNKESIKEHSKDKGQNIKDYQREYRKNMIDEEKQKMKDYQREYRKNMTDEQKQRYKENRNKSQIDKRKQELNNENKEIVIIIIKE